eukprot:9075789-Pyramimonas_sp.AAC.1
MHGVIPNFWRWQGLLWACASVFMRGTAFAINNYTALDAAKHCDDIVRGIQDAWSPRQSAEAFAALRRVVAGPRCKRMLKGLPIPKDIHAQPVASQLQAARRWQQHFGTLELAATFEHTDVSRLAGHVTRV